MGLMSNSGYFKVWDSFGLSKFALKHTRKDAIHKFIHKIVKENSLIIVGNVSSQKLAKIKLVKSVLDAGS
jgi:hypothetical protein